MRRHPCHRQRAQTEAVKFLVLAFAEARRRGRAPPTSEGGFTWSVMDQDLGPIGMGALK